MSSVFAPSTCTSCSQLSFRTGHPLHRGGCNTDGESTGSPPDSSPGVRRGLHPKDAGPHAQAFESRSIFS